MIVPTRLLSGAARNLEKGLSNPEIRLSVVDPAMNTPIPTSRQRASIHGNSAFTLIELLVVITIIAVLAGLLLPVVNSVQNTAKKTSTRSTEMQIVAAINAYQTEYSQYPVRSGTTMDYTYDTTTNHNGELFDVLRALNNVQDPTTPTGSLNSRRIIYFEAKNVKNVTTPRDGFILTGNPTGNNSVTLNIGDFVDPYGNLYCIRMDSNYTNAIINPYSNASTSASDDASSSGSTTSTQDQQNQLRTGVVAYSVGADGMMGNKGNVGSAPYSPTPGDDVVSWQ